MGKVQFTGGASTLPSGIAGAIQFSNGSAFSSDATNFFWDDTNNRLGIGINTLRTSLDIYNYAIPPIITVSSQKAFDVAGTLIGGIQGIQHPTLTASSGAMYFKSETGNAAQGKITFETGSALGASSEKMVIGFNGNVGIGTATPTARLHAKGSGTTSATSSFLAENSAGTVLVQVNDDGNVGIGTNSPTQKLYMKNGAAPMFGIDTVSSQTELNIYNQSTYAAALKLNSATGKITWANGSYIDTNSNGLIMQNNTANTVLRVAAAPSIGSTIFQVTDNTFATGLFVVKGNGNILIGTITDIASSKLTVDSTTQGILPPRMTTVQKNAITSPASGLIVYDTTTNKLCCYNGTIWNDLF